MCPQTGETVAIVDALTAEGFEAVAACATVEGVVVTYEDRRYRYDVRALDRAAAITGSQGASEQPFRLVPTRNGVPIVSVDATASGALRAGTLDTGHLPTSVPRRPWPSLDLVLHPLVRLAFGDFDEPVRADLGVAPTALIDLWPGARVTAQVLVPFVERADEETQGIRPGIVAGHQEWRLPFASFARVSAGLFTRDRYGVDLTTTTYLANGRAAVTLRAGRTGFARLTDGTWQYSALDLTTASAQVSAVIAPTYGLSTGVTAGRFLSGEAGVRVDLSRTFGETDVSVFGLTSGGEPNVGGRISIPLPVRRHARPGRVRARLADAFEAEYRYRRVPGEAPSYDVDPAPWRPLGDLNPSLLPYRIQRLDAP